MVVIRPHDEPQTAINIILFYIIIELHSGRFIGRYEISPFTVMKLLGSFVFPIEQTWTNADEIIILQVRLPRIISALLSITKCVADPYV